MDVLDAPVSCSIRNRQGKRDWETENLGDVARKAGFFFCGLTVIGI
jgi:hypothetical protein